MEANGSYDILNSATTGQTLGASQRGLQAAGPGASYPRPLPVFGAGAFSAISMAPESPMLIAGALLLLPIGASALRILRGNRAA